jgi:hypothetical protein
MSGTYSVGQAIKYLETAIQEGVIKEDSPLILGTAENGTVILYNIDEIVVTPSPPEPVALVLSVSGIQHVERTEDAPLLS